MFRQELRGKLKRTRTATEHCEPVKKQLRKFAACGFVKAIPPRCEEICHSWCFEVSAAHYVPSTKWNNSKGDRFVAHLSKPPDGGADGTDHVTDVNSMSKEMNTSVQADYIDQVVVEFMEYLELRCDGEFSQHQLILIEADVKAAFKCVVLHLDLVGSMCTEFEGWLYVYTRTVFGWKWATHTWSPFAKAIKQKLRKLERNGWGGAGACGDWLRMAARANIMHRQNQGSIAWSWRVSQHYETSGL